MKCLTGTLQISTCKLQHIFSWKIKQNISTFGLQKKASYQELFYLHFSLSSQELMLWVLLQEKGKTEKAHKDDNIGQNLKLEFLK